jgi:CHAT domain-containing protein/tetratricopeptide (TPR) repeat protein
MLARAVACFAILPATVAPAAGASAERTLQGVLAITAATGHDCLVTPPLEVSVELVIDAPTGGFALIGFADGHAARWTYASGMLTVANDVPPVVVEIALAAQGSDVTLIAPGTETCRWSGTLRLRPSQATDRLAREARLVALDAANAVFAEGDALLAKGKGAEALPIYERAVALRKAALGEEHPLALAAESRIARSLQLDGKADAARERVERVLAIQRRVLGEDAFGTLRSRVALGTMYWEAGRPQDGLPIVEQAHAQLRDRYGPAHSETLVAQGNLALILWHLGRLEEAARHLEHQLPHIVAIRGESHQRSLDAMNNLALVYQGMGRHAAALELLERAYRLSVASLGPDHPDTLTTLLSVGVGYASLDRMEDALALYRTTYSGLRRVLGDDHPWTLTAQSNIAASLLDLDRVDDALAIAPDLVQRAERAMGPAHVYTLRWRGMLGGIHYQSGDFAAAAVEYERLHTEQAKAFGAEHPDTLESVSNLGQSYFASGRRDEGAAMLDQALRDLRRVNGASHRVTLTTTVALAEVAAAQGDRTKATLLLSGLVEAVERLRADEGLARETRQAFFARWSIGYKRLALLQAASDPVAAFGAAELSKARMLLESLALRSADMAGVIGGEDATRLASLDERAGALGHAIAQAAGRGDEAFKLETERNAVTREASLLRKALRERNPRYAQLSEVELVDAARARALARRGEAIVSYLIADDEVIAFIVRRDRPLRVASLGRIAGLDRTVEAYRTLLAGSLVPNALPVWKRRNGGFVTSLSQPPDAIERVRDGAVIGRALADRLIKPLQSALSGTTRWIVSPDGALAALPFEVLPHRGRPLVATHELSYVQSLSVLALMQARPGLKTASGSLLAMGAPKFSDGTALASDPGKASETLVQGLARGSVAQSLSRSYVQSGATWSPLPGAEREIESVARLFPAAERMVAIREAASEARLRSLNASGELAGFRYLLFSTHAYLDMAVPARSALVLSQIDLAPGTDGYVTAAKWSAYRLQSDLTVLSACETGLGRQVQGEGVMGLPYALFVAGNRATVLTLWRIEDTATAIFVTEFFRRLRAGSDATAALTATKRAFIAGSPRNRAPAIWAPFVLYGT